MDNIHRGSSPRPRTASEPLVFLGGAAFAWECRERPLRPQRTQSPPAQSETVMRQSLVRWKPPDSRRPGLRHRCTTSPRHSVCRSSMMIPDARPNPVPQLARPRAARPARARPPRRRRVGADWRGRDGPERVQNWTGQRRRRRTRAGRQCRGNDYPPDAAKRESAPASELGAHDLVREADGGVAGREGQAQSELRDARPRHVIRRGDIKASGTVDDRSARPREDSASPSVSPATDSKPSGAASGGAGLVVKPRVASGTAALPAKSEMPAMLNV